MHAVECRPIFPWCRNGMRGPQVEDAIALHREVPLNGVRNERPDIAAERQCAFGGADLVGEVQIKADFLAVVPEDEIKWRLGKTEFRRDQLGEGALSGAPR